MSADSKLIARSPGRYGEPNSHLPALELAILIKSAPKGAHMPPTLANGKICYVELPATDIARSSEFYQRVFGWQVRTRQNGSVAFDDTTGQVSGTWITGRSPASAPGILFYIMVDSVEASVAAVIQNGGEIVQKIGMDAPEITARFRDPGGNIVGLYQEPSR
jgi:uncharacterized protein